MLEVTNPPHKRLALFGFLLLRTIFTIQGTHNSLYAIVALGIALNRISLMSFGTVVKFRTTNTATA
jgi:hypothetical protein